MAAKVKRSGALPHAKVVGVLGGMGPAAALEFCRRLLEATPGVRREQDHLRVILDNNAKIPDRTRAIAGRGPSPLPELLKSARALESAGAEFLAVPCNTVHRWYDALCAGVTVPVIHLIETTVEAARKRAGGKRARRVGVLATEGALRVGLYQEELARRGLQALLPTPAEQADLMEAILAVKVRRGGADAPSRKAVRRVGERLAKRGAQVLVLGCTELPLALAGTTLSIPVVDSLDALVKETLRRARTPRSRPSRRTSR